MKEKFILDDVEITKDSMYKRAQKGIGYLAQEASVFRKLSVEDNIMSVLAIYRSEQNGTKRKTGISYRGIQPGTCSQKPR